MSKPPDYLQRGIVNVGARPEGGQLTIHAGSSAPLTLWQVLWMSNIAGVGLCIGVASAFFALKRGAAVLAATLPPLSRHDPKPAAKTCIEAQLPDGWRG